MPLLHWILQLSGNVLRINKMIHLVILKIVQSCHKIWFIAMKLHILLQFALIINFDCIWGVRVGLTRICRLKNGAYDEFFHVYLWYHFDEYYITYNLTWQNLQYIWHISWQTTLYQYTEECKPRDSHKCISNIYCTFIDIFTDDMN